MKISYSYMQNTKSIINNHSMKFLNNTARLRNCRNKNNSPLDGKCLTSNIIYEAQITSNKLSYKENFFKETAKTDFKHRFNNHTKSFNLEHYENDTELSKEHWTIKRNYFKPKCFLCKPWTVEPDLESESKLDFNHEMSPFYFFNFFFYYQK